MFPFRNEERGHVLRSRLLWAGHPNESTRTAGQTSDRRMVTVSPLIMKLTMSLSTRILQRHSHGPVPRMGRTAALAAALDFRIPFQMGSASKTLTDLLDPALK